ncbi:hypothetical protein BASA50_006377 [Batrachochytrium salamandrivorans]|uniref:DH domain-containing protein n=1 Tax=Batrachochytrium salamandrivorans TaxID=1357716 RepID=A0ABQ8FCY2_9FUNG|nr:hypothetical protein BASA60_003072 [Batrachochytrium salamandrivorans]KAH6594700.1 hypothetical protein BASA50_006377 [Batrachochytrium salamandrivorans]
MPPRIPMHPQDTGATMMSARSNYKEPPVVVDSGHRGPPGVYQSNIRNILSSESIQEFSIIYPALLSQVARAFLNRIPLDTHMKDLLEYSDSFLGRDAVDILAYIIKTSDRNLALLLGRALDAQGFFHDVTYTHRLRDSPSELFKFESWESEGSDIDEAERFPHGVFTLLTDCYTPTCTRDRLCYSITCPRRIEQRTRIHRQEDDRSNRYSSHDSITGKSVGALWSTSVSKEVLASVSDKEKLRQEVIFEIVNGEREFVEDLETTVKVFMQPLRERNIIEPERREQFVKDVFLNISELHTINSKLLRKLISRQKEAAIVDKIGDIFINIADEFYPYVEYGAKQVFAKNLLDEEKATNPELVKFLKECERLPVLRKLPLESFLARPTTRMGRYPLLLKPVMEKSTEGHSDRTLIPQALLSIREVLSSINVEAGKADNIVKLSRLEKQLVFSEGEKEDLRLNDEGRTIVRDGKLMLKRSGNDIEMSVFLFDHMFLIARKKENGHYRVARKPIPLELLSIRYDKPTPRMADVVVSASSKGSSLYTNTIQKSSTLGHRHTASSSSGATGTLESSSRAFLINVTHLGRYGGQYTLLASTQSDRQAWCDAIEKQIASLAERKRKFEIITLVSTGFPVNNRINCSILFQDRLVLGTDFGLFVGPEYLATSAISNDVLDNRFVKVIDLERIVQVDVLLNNDNLLVLSDKTLFSFPLQVLDSLEEDSSNILRHGKKIGSHVSFFKQGVCSERTLVCAVKSTALTATIKVLEPVGLSAGNLRGKIGKLFRATNDALRVYKEFYIPTESKSIHFLKSKLCVGCAKGFEIVDLESLNTQGLLDPTDESLEFVLKKETVRPISIFRVRDGDFFLCYNEFGFYIDRLGRRAKGDWIIQWAGVPTAFSFVSPYIIAFEPSFVEIRHVDTGELQQIIPTNNLRALNSDPDVLHCVTDLTTDVQQVFRLQPFDQLRLQ